MATVLVVDDNVEDVGDLIETIKDKGHGVIYHSCSRDAQAEIRSTPIDCGIYDLMLPRYSEDSELSAEFGGLLLVRESQRFRPDARVVVHTSKCDAKYRHELGTVPVFIKRETSVEEIIRNLGL